MDTKAEDPPGRNNNKVICAICYEEAKPASEDLQSISLCGHVFHELCLQQWLEYCPRGRKCTCPLCKQQCSGKDVHRLYFQSASESSTQPSQGNCLGLPNACDVETLQATVQKLTGQLSVTKSSLEANQELLQESDRQLWDCIIRAERAESAEAEAQREKSGLKDVFLRTQEELKRSTSERRKLLEKVTSLTKELATNNLANNLDVDEDDVARMARVGCGNKDDVIGTITRCLIVRNRAYKDLMAKCNMLGSGENKALRKYEKAFERIKLLKVRVQELERLQEEKENENLRCQKVLSKLGSKHIDSPVTTAKNLHTPLLASNPPLPLQPSSQMKLNAAIPHEAIRISKAVGSVNDSRNVCIFLEEEEDSQLLVSKEAGLCEKNRVQNASHSAQKDSLTRVDSTYSRSGFNDISKIPLEDGSRQGCESFSSTLENGVNEPDGAVSMMEREPCSDILSTTGFPLTIKKEVRCSSGIATETGAPTSIWDNQMPNASKWCKQSSSWRAQHEGSLSGFFISCGANGRGGQVKVLRPPPMLKVGGASCDNWLRPPAAKKLKSSRNVQTGGNQQGSLQIEHFFGSL